MMQGYKELQGILVKKRRSILGKYLFIIEEHGSRANIYVGKAIYDKAEVGSQWTIGHIKGQLIHIRPGFCDSSER